MKKLKSRKGRRFKIGYGAFQEAYKNPTSRRQLANCFSCKYYEQLDEDPKEYCQNGNVLRYDMIVADNRIWCGYWKGVWE